MLEMARVKFEYFREKLGVEFEMKELGMMHYFLGMKVWQNADGISPR